MYLALIDYRGTCDAMVGLSYGTLEDIKESIISNDSELLDPSDADELEDSGLDNYNRLVSAEDEEELYEIISNYCSEISDCTTTVICLTDKYEELKSAWIEFVAGNMWLQNWRLPDKIDETPQILDELDFEMRSLGDSNDYSFIKMMYSVDED